MVAKTKAPPKSEIEKRLDELERRFNRTEAIFAQRIGQVEDEVKRVESDMEGAVGTLVDGIKDTRISISKVRRMWLDAVIVAGGAAIAGFLACSIGGAVSEMVAMAAGG